MRKFVKIAFVAVFAAVAGYGVYTSQKSEFMSDLALANVEALAGYEVNPQCPNGCTSELSKRCICFKIYNDMREVSWH